MMKEDVIVRNSFVTNRKLLLQFRLQQLIMSQDYDEATLGIDFALFLCRTDKNTMLEDIVVEQEALKVLQKRDSTDIWREFER